jgi:hypothetical protein
MGSYIIKCGEILKNEDGSIAEIHCTADLEVGTGVPTDRKVKGTIHWLSAEYAQDTTVVMYDRLFTAENMNDLPDGFSCPSDRVKPWGTAHALRACRNIVDDNFVIFNSDDFYGKETFEAMFKSLSEVNSENFTMPGFVLKNTLSENGHVARGICKSENGYIKHIREIKKIMKVDAETKYEENGEWRAIDENSLVSMNFWGFTPDIFCYVEECFVDFLSDQKTDILTDEFYIPTVIEYGITNGKFDCRILKTNAKWMGVTYRSDKPAFQEYLNGMINDGLYPENLWA